MLWSYTGSTGFLDVRHTVYSLSKDWSTPLASVGQFFSILALVIIVAGLAYYTTRMLASAKFARGGRRNLEILESMGVGPQSFVHIVRVGGQYVLIGVTRGQVSFLTQLEGDHLTLPEPGKQMIGFESLLNRFQGRSQKGSGNEEDLKNDRANNSRDEGKDNNQ